MTMIVFTAVLLIGNILKEILALLIQGQVSAGIAAQAMGLLLPFVWVYALPMGMLTATLLVFGRFSADQELTAARASGISLMSLVMPIFLLSLLLCGISAWVNLEVAPRCRIAYKNLLFKLGAELSNVRLPEGRYISDFPGCTIYIGKKHEKEKLENVIIILDLTNSTITAQAPRGQYRLDKGANQIVLELFDVHGVQISSDSGSPVSFAELPIYLPLPLSERKQPRISDMTLIELQRELRRIEKQLRTVRPPPGASTNTLAELHRTRETQVKDITTPIRVQIHRSVATSFACFGFTLVGIPLAIRLHRRETNVGFGVALALVLIYYGFISVAQSLDTRPELVPHLILWLPNIIFQAVGVVLLWRANRGV